MRVAPMTSRFLDACRRRPTDVSPVWFMRQAGRYMKQYRDLRLKHGILEICKRPDLAAAVVRTTAFARSPLAGLASEVFGVFDSTMDRVSAKFTAQSRKLVAIAGIAVALALPLDTFDLLKRLARSDSAREQAVMLAETFAEQKGYLKLSAAVAEFELPEGPKGSPAP